jgi:arginase
MKCHRWGLVLLALAGSSAGAAERYRDAQGRIRIGLVKMPYRGERNLPELSSVPDYLEEGGLARQLEQLSCRLKPIETVGLTPEQQKEYGIWHRLGLANGQLARLIAANEKAGYFSVGLLANCSSLMGMLAGLQHSSASGKPLRVGLLFIDAHGDFNTPETTLSGMLGGMPVAVSAGLCLTNLRLKSGLEPALPTRYIVLAGVRDTDPLEQELLDRSEIQLLSVDDLRAPGEKLKREMKRLSELTDIIYVHVDMDVLDPAEVSGHPLTVPNGPTSRELAAAISEMFRYQKAAAFGVASTPAGENDKGGLSLKAAYNLIAGAIEGVGRR